MDDRYGITDEWVAGALRDAYHVATGSPDPSSQIGAILFDRHLRYVSQACNTFTFGMKPTPERLERPLKYEFIEHAERNAIYLAARTVAQPKIMVCNWAACTECARAIVQAGIEVLVRHKQASDRSQQRWIDSLQLAEEIMAAGGVEIIDYDGFLGAKAVWHCEELWTP